MNTENTPKPYLNPSTFLTNLLIQALQDKYPDGAFPGGQIMDIRIREGRNHEGEDCGPEVSIEFDADRYHFKPTHCLIHIGPDYN